MKHPRNTGIPAEVPLHYAISGRTAKLDSSNCIRQKAHIL
jgi:hypothetical protein